MNTRTRLALTAFGGLIVSTAGRHQTVSSRDVQVVGLDPDESPITATTRLVGTGRLAADGTVTVKLKKLAKGKHVLTARYLGSDSIHAVTTPKKRVRVR